MTRAIRYHEYGGPEVMKIEQVTRPVAKEGEILVRVHALGVNPVDWKVRSGLAKARFTLPFPVIPGGDLAGAIEEVGPQVKDFAVGQRVFALVGLWGASSELLAVKAEIAAPMPVTLDFEHAAAVPLTALTAWQALFEQAELKSGQRVLIHAAAGGVGSFAVQLARNAGATVVGTASAANHEYVRSLGAAEVIDYAQSGAFESFRGSFDVVFDLIGGEASLRSLELLRKGGLHVGGVPAPALAQQAEAAGIRVKALQVRPDGRELREISQLIDAGKIRTTIAATFPWSEIGRAHEQIKAGHTRGKIVLSVSP